MAINFIFPVLTHPQPHCGDLTFTLLCRLTCVFVLQEEGLLPKDVRRASRLLPRDGNLQQLQVSGSWTRSALRGLLIWVLFVSPLSCFSSSPAVPRPVHCVSPLTVAPHLFPVPLHLRCPQSCPLYLSPLTSHHCSLTGPLSCLLTQVQERQKALQAEVALTLKVLGNMTDPALVTILGQPLHTLSHIHSQLQTCVSPGALAPPHCDSSPLGLP